jgi:hypothetical protein
MLYCLGTPGSGLEQRLESSAKLPQACIRMLTMPRRRTVNPVKRRRNLQDLATGLKKVVVKHIHRITRFLHESRSSAPRLIRYHHGKTGHDMQTLTTPVSGPSPTPE